MPWGLKRYYGTGSLHCITWSCYRRKRLELVGGENSAERWLRVGKVSAKSLTSRKEREKWGTRPRLMMMLGDGGFVIFRSV
jgi:hypothetical protein